MSVITKVPEPNIYEEICKDYQDYDPSKHNPVFFGKMYSHIPTDTLAYEEVDVAQTHPSVIGYAFTEKPTKSPSPPPTPRKRTKFDALDYVTEFLYNNNSARKDKPKTNLEDIPFVRKDPEVQELRQWQAEWREEKGDVSRRVSDFWEKKMPESPNNTNESITPENKSTENKTDTVKTPPV
ncbi:hypothetical protein MAR_027884 [Mya arenaria]|uniref:Uncharacterized protein n=1 Tax=Mya arenaria TaxID=6604 RepID=A0ABY7DFI2_MYAAR|nr:hypothetical protein MAR_027884 [Mya arenaria]